MAEYSMNFYQHFGSIPVANDYRYSHDQASNITPKTSSWFRRPAKVSKLGGRESSPRSLVRRRTTALVHAPSRQRSITDGKGHQKHFSTPSGPANHEGTGRPLSWHSTSMQQADHYFLPSTAQFQSDVSTPQFLAPTFTTSDFNEAITPMTYPSAGEPFVQGAFTPLEEMSSQDFDDRYAFLNEFSADMNTFYDPQYGARYTGLTGSDHQYPNGLYQYQKQPEYCLRQLEETAPPTPEVGPLQTSTGLIADEPLGVVEQAGAEDLVGMGLYDAPSPLPASMSFLSGSWDIPIRPISGKGLKLEETFEPTTTEDDDNDDDNDEEAAASEDGEEEESCPDQAQCSMIPDLGQEDGRPNIEQNMSANFNFTPDFTIQGNAWWDTNAAANHGWV